MAFLHIPLANNIPVLQASLKWSLFYHALRWSLQTQSTPGLGLLKTSLKLNSICSPVILACLHVCSHPASDAPHGAINAWQAKTTSPSA